MRRSQSVFLSLALTISLVLALCLPGSGPGMLAETEARGGGGVAAPEGGATLGGGATAVWPNVGYDADLTGHCPYAGPVIEPKLRWQFDLAGSYVGVPPVIGPDGTIYACNAGGGTLYAVSPDGQEKWRYDARKEINALAVDGWGQVYLAAGFTVTAVDSGGKPIWEGKTRGETFGLTIGPDGLIYATARDTYHAVYVFDAKGGLVWAAPTPKGIELGSCAPAVVAPDGTVFYAGFGSSNVVALKGGVRLWAVTGYRQSEDTGLCRAADGTLYVFNGKNQLAALSQADGSPKWVHRTGDVFSGQPSVALDGTVYSAGSVFLAFGPDGGRKWSIQSFSKAGAKPIVGADGTVYFSQGYDNYDAYLCAASPSGDLLWKVKTPGWPAVNPVLGRDGVLYIVTWDGSSAYLQAWK